MKKTIPFLLSLAITAALTGCSGNKPTETTAAETTAAETTAAETTAAETTAAETSETEATEPAASAAVRVGSLKGPTSMGLVHLMDAAKTGDTANSYEFTMVTAADELIAKVASSELDIALVPANVASVLYNKTKGAVSVIDINTLGVLDIVTSDDSIASIADLKGKTIYMTGKGTSPDYVFRYLLSENGLTENDVTIEFKSEPTEVAAILKEQKDAIGLLPQPFVTAACAQNDSLKIVLDLTKEWQAVQGEGGSQLVTGVTIARNDFLNSNPDAVTSFLKEHAASAEFTNSKPDEASELIAELGIVAKAPLAKKAIPYCNITCITGEEMQTALSGYLQVLFDQNPASVGGTLPENGFYYIP